MAFTVSNLIARFRSLFGEEENTSQDVKTRVDRLFEGVTTWWWPHSIINADGAVTRNVDSNSLLLTATYGPLTCFTAPFPCEIVDLRFSLDVSATITNTASVSFGVLVTKRGGTASTASATMTRSTTYFIGALTTDTGKNPTKSWSWSSLTANLANVPNKLHLATGTNATKLKLGEGAALLCQITKGQAADGSDTGARFAGGLLTIVYRKTDSP